MLFTVGDVGLELLRDGIPAGAVVDLGVSLPLQLAEVEFDIGR